MTRSTAATRRPTYRFAVAWIAQEDEPGDLDPAVIAGYISTCLVADLWGKDEADVAEDVARYRRRAALDGSESTRSMG
jgi:hypothetical protein